MGTPGKPLWAHWGLSEGLGSEVSVLELPPLEQCPGLGCATSEDPVTEDLVKVRVLKSSLAE